MIGSHPRSALIFALLVTGASTTLGSLGCKKEAVAEQTQAVAPPVHVETSDVVAIDAPKILRLTGTLRGSKETDLAANVSGRITKTTVERGTEVKLNDVLAQVDVSAAALSLAEASVSVATSKTQQEIFEADCARYEQLKAKGAVSDFEYDQATAKCKTAALSLQAAQARRNAVAKNVGDGIIRAPFAGVVTERYVEVGEYVQPPSRVVSIAQLDELKLEFSVPEANWPSVKQGADVAFRVVAYEGEDFHGKVTHISSAVRDTRDVLVEALVENPDKKLLPGMFADVHLSVGTTSVPSIPKTAMFEQTGKLNTFIVKDGMLVQRVIQTLPEHDGRIPVLNGVAIGDKVVTTYSDKLSNGQNVN